MLLLGAGLRLAGIGWGIPRYDAELAAGTPLRTSYHPDEDKLLEPLAAGAAPRSYWGALTTTLTAGALRLAERCGAFGGDWRHAYLAATPDLPGVLVTGRAVSVMFGVLSIAVVWAWARGVAGDAAGLLSALLLAVAPLHLVHCDFLTPDAGVTFWVALALWRLSLGCPLGGVALGLALATKPSAIFALPALLSLRGRARLLAAGAVALGFVLGDPLALLQVGTIAELMAGLLRDNATRTPGAALRVWAFDAWQIAWYGVGPVATVAALARLRRAPRPTALALVALFFSLGLSRIPLARYTLPLLPPLAALAGVALIGLPPRARAMLAGLAVLPGLALSVGQIGILRDTHSAQRAADWIVANVAPGARIAQLWPEYPLLDPRRYALAGFDDAFALLGLPQPPLAAEIVILDDLPIAPWRPELLADLQRNYRLAASFARPPRLGGWPLPEPAAAHDWKYTHPALRVYRRIPTPASAAP